MPPCKIEAIKPNPNLHKGFGANYIIPANLKFFRNNLATISIVK